MNALIRFSSLDKHSRLTDTMLLGFSNISVLFLQMVLFNHSHVFVLLFVSVKCLDFVCENYCINKNILRTTEQHLNQYLLIQKICNIDLPVIMALINFINVRVFKFRKYIDADE